MAYTLVDFHTAPHAPLAPVRVLDRLPPVMRLEVVALDLELDDGARAFYQFNVRLQRRVPREVPEEFVRVGEAQALGQVTDQQDPERVIRRVFLAAIASHVPKVSAFPLVEPRLSLIHI